MKKQSSEEKKMGQEKGREREKNTLPSLILTHFPRHIIEFRSIPYLLKRLFLLGVFFAQDMADIDASCWFEFAAATAF